MNFKFIFFAIIVFFATLSQAQKEIPFGELLVSERLFDNYEKDSTAHAVVLFEKGNTYFEVLENRIYLIKKFHAKIKILDSQGFDEGTISIPYYKKGDSREEVSDLKAVTHNGENKVFILPTQIYTTDLTENWSEKKFTFPNIQKGSVLEYQYKIISPFFYSLNGWEFQSHLPKVHSEYNATIPANYKYNRTLRGSIPLNTNEASIKKGCFSVEGITGEADCEVLLYIMKDVPAFKVEDEEFMLAATNYMSSIDFELSEYHKFNGGVDKYTKSWKDVDSEFRGDMDIGQQLTKKGFFEKNVPEKLLTEGDALTRAKNIYAFVQNHYVWNEKYGIYGNNKVKEAFAEKKGNVAEINMSLINLLHAAGIKTNLMLLSTRKNSLPLQDHPVMSGFNYLIAKIEIDGQNHLLDATDKLTPFGMLPFRALNHYGRVMDFENESYWYDIRPETDNKFNVRASVKFDLEENKATGILYTTHTGYNAVTLNRTLNDHSKEKYLESVENSAGGNLEITAYELMKEKSDDKKVLQRFEFEVENLLNGDLVYLNPFFVRFFEKNPFLQEERSYPIDFGYPRSFKYQLNIALPEGYVVQELPKDVTVFLGKDIAKLNFYNKSNEGQVAINFDLDLHHTYFVPEDYDSLKQLFKHVTDIQKNALIVLKRN